jgi:hypothetical protein
MSHPKTIDRLLAQLEHYPEHKLAGVVKDQGFEYGKLVGAAN